MGRQVRMTTIYVTNLRPNCSTSAIHCDAFSQEEQCLSTQQQRLLGNQVCTVQQQKDPGRTRTLLVEKFCSSCRPQHTHMLTHTHIHTPTHIYTVLLTHNPNPPNTVENRLTCNQTWTYLSLSLSSITLILTPPLSPSLTLFLSLFSSHSINLRLILHHLLPSPLPLPK